MTNPAPIAGILGHPIGHSLSPALHNGWLKELGLPGAYLAFDVPPENLGAAISAWRTLGFVGGNITLPHKEAVRAHLDEIDEGARAIGAVNTIVRNGDKLIGSNTDAAGFAAHLMQSHPQWPQKLSTRPVLVLGAGGGARGVIFGLAQSGARSFMIANRDRQRAERLAADYAAIANIACVDWAERDRAASEAGLIVNTTSLGMRNCLPLDLNLDGAKSAIIADIVYQPLETELLKTAHARGLATLDGLGMLIAQASFGFSAWFGAEPPRGDHTRTRLLALLTGR